MRPFEVLVPREQKPACLQHRFNSLATEQVYGKEKLSGADAQTRCFSSDSFECTSVPDTSADDQCPPENSIQVVRDWYVLLCSRFVSVLWVSPDVPSKAHHRPA